VSAWRVCARRSAGFTVEVVHERRVRGAIERRYRLRSGAASVDADEAATMTVDELRRAFLTFVATAVPCTAALSFTGSSRPG
jgi:hypothetical protein